MISLVSYEQAESRQRLILLRFGPIQAWGVSVYIGLVLQFEVKQKCM